MKLAQIKRWLIGEPFPTSMEVHERLDKVRGLAVFASDPISSNAYATEAIMHVLIVLGSGALSLTLPVGMAVAGLVLLVIFSYVQTINHYPQGGGAYIVAKDNLGTMPSLVAGAALLLDYVLTVSVSAAAGVRAVTSAFPELQDQRVVLALGAIAFIAWINLRGARESGTIFAIPTYAFVGGGLLVIGIGLLRYWGLFGFEPLHPIPHIVEPQADLVGFGYVWLLLRAFAGGCTALTGIEAISDGVKAFKPPEARNAATTMVAMGIMAMSLFLGITFLATHLQLIPEEQESILSQLTSQVVGRGFLYYWVQFFTAGILFLAANTGYQDFPRLSFYLAKDGFMPRWMSRLGERLVFSSGIVTLTVLAAIMIILFDADEITMLPLYAVGVMLSFTLSQSGMFRLMGRIGKLKPGEELHTDNTLVHYEKAVFWKRLINGVGAVVTGVVLVILVATKFIYGAWIIVVAIPLLVVFFLSIHRHYQTVSASLSTRNLDINHFPSVANVVVVPIGDVHKGTLMALQYAKRLSTDVRAVCITTSPEMRERLEKRWNRFPQITNEVQLVCIEYDYRDILTPLVDYIVHVNDIEFPNQMTTVVVPEFVAENQFARLLHNQTALMLQLKLLNYPDVLIIEVPYHIGVNRIMDRRTPGSAFENPEITHAPNPTQQNGEGEENGDFI